MRAVVRVGARHRRRASSWLMRPSAGEGHSVAITRTHRSGRAGRGTGCRASLRADEGAWWSSATATAGSLTFSTRSMGRSHAASRARAVAV